MKYGMSSSISYDIALYFTPCSKMFLKEKLPQTRNLPRYVEPLVLRDMLFLSVACCCGRKAPYSPS